MNLDKEFKIVTDREGVTLQQTVTSQVKDKETGQMKIKTTIKNFYYPTIEAALRKYVREVPKHSRDIAEVLIKMNEALETIRNLKLKI